MNVKTDEELLRAFVDRGDEAAFRAIVDRHIKAVHAAARRQIRDAQLAEDAAQATFVMLARKAASIRDGAVLGGWLITTARLAAKTALRGEIRRKRREQRAATMSLQQQQNEQPGRGGGGDNAADVVERDDTLRRVEQQLDDALARLKPADRTAVTLRYLQSRPLREVAEVMGTTEQAASKRVARAVAKLKKTFQRRGIDLTPAAVVAALERQAHVELPPGLADGAFTAATTGGSAGAGTGTAAVTIARDALAHAAMRAALIAASVLVVVGAVITAGVIASRPANRTVTTMPPADPARPPLRVGLYLSHDTAVHRSKERKPRGWADQIRILDELQPFPGLDVRPLVEPDGADDALQAQKLKQYFAGKRTIDVTDADALRREVDVILVSAVCEPPTAALDAIEQAVRGGTGLVVRQCFGGHSDRLGAYAHPQVRLLRGVQECDAEMVTHHGGYAPAEVVAAHPLLGELAGRRGSKVMMLVYGAYGTLADGATPLLEVRDLDALQHHVHKDALEPKPGWAFVPLNVAQLDNGRIVSCSFGVNRLPQELDLATQGKFTLNALKWASGRNVE